MSRAFVVSGTDTDVGKTVVAAMLALGLDGTYWKPVQAGLGGETDTQAVRRMTGLPEERFIPERYRLREPLSPHRAAELEGVEIDPGALSTSAPPAGGGGMIIIEGAGGLMVPLTRETLFIDVFRRWGLPVILCARTALGTINHTLLSVEALKSRDIPLHGIIFNGADNPDTIRTIADFSGATILGRLPVMAMLTPEDLRRVFNEGFQRGDF